MKDGRRPAFGVGVLLLHCLGTVREYLISRCHLSQDLKGLGKPTTWVWRKTLPGPTEHPGAVGPAGILEAGTNGHFSGIPLLAELSSDWGVRMEKHPYLKFYALNSHSTYL